MSRSTLWRFFLVLAGAFILYGGPRHPDGTLLEMLRDPAWVSSHLWITLGYVAFIAALLIWRNQRMPGGEIERWWRWTIVASALQTVEMVFHTAAYVDAEALAVAAGDTGALAAGAATPVLTTHIVLTLIAYPIFGVVTAIFLWKAGSERILGSKVSAAVAGFGLLCQGIGPFPTILLGIDQAAVLFPLVMFFAFGMLLTAAWPVGPPDERAAPASSTT